MTLAVLLAALALFQIKHLLADYVLQTAWMIREKGSYGRPGGLAHAGVHVLWTAPILAWLGTGWFLALGLLLAEFLLHYHIDWAKAKLSRWAALSTNDQRFWVAHGADQSLHQFTYIGILLVLAL